MTVLLSWWSSRVRIIGTLGSFSNDDGDGNENVKKTIGLVSKTTNLHVHLAFLYFSQPPLQEYDVKMPHFTFYGGRKGSDDKFFFLSLNFSAVPKKSTPGKFAHFWHFKRIGINAENKFEKREFIFKGPCSPKRLCALVFLFWNDSFVKCSVLIGFHFWGALRDDTKNDCEGD